ncbi:MAG: hypothetical protein KAI97_06515, partial [Gemmatimonadetes bacterium]|nr:hypothetical protein [Gemmatimonadota bacterium]
MGIRTARTAAVVIVSVCALFWGSADADPVSYFETFFSSTYQDITATTADWNQGAGHIALPDVQLVLGTGYDTPGAAVGIDSDGKYVYVADWTSGLEIFDGRTTPPTLIGSYDTAGEAHTVAVDGNYAYVADGDLGLQIVDISVPTSPTFAGSLALGGRTYDVVVHGDYVIATHWRSTPFALNYITVIDVSDPTSPAIAGSVTMSGLAWRLFVDGDYVYVADGSSGLQIISLATPT